MAEDANILAVWMGPVSCHPRNQIEDKNWLPPNGSHTETHEVNKPQSGSESMETNKLDFQIHDAMFSAINKSQGIVEFEMDGTITTANDIFLEILGYSLEEVKGKHHSIFCEKSYADSPEYKNFWKKLNRGEFDSGEYKRVGKNGKELYIQATYNPIFDSTGKPVKVLKIATDVTALKIMNAEFEGKVNAIDKSQGTIEFNMDGTIITANDNFLKVLGYSLDEVKGKHHSIFCEDDYAKSEEYKKFWKKLNRGEFDCGEYKRIGKNGREVYIQATYNPIYDLNGKPMKVFKMATDVTERKRLESERERQAELIMEMSTPVMQLWDGILLLPIVGLVDSERVRLIMDTVLQRILDYQATVVILDIQGVPTVDSTVADHLISITRASKLMGCNCIITGISPEISQSLVDLEMELQDIMTQSSLKDGVKTSMAEINCQIVENKRKATKKKKKKEQEQANELEVK